MFRQVLLEHIAHREKYLRSPGIDVELGLEHPHADRDRHRCLAVVAQRDLDEHPSVRRVVVAVHPKTDGVAQLDRRRLPGIEIGKADGARFFDRDALEMANRTARLGDLVGLHRLVRSPRRRDRERLQIWRYLEPQTHRRGNHQPLLGRPVLSIIVGSVGLVRRRRRTPECPVPQPRHSRRPELRPARRARCLRRCHRYRPWRQ